MQSEKNRDEFLEELRKKCPLFWRHIDKTSRYWFCYPSVSSGWYNIVDEASIKIEKLIEPLKYIFPKEELPRPVQIKEKFGTMRFYWDSCETPNEILQKINDVVDIAEQKSKITCEYCESFGKLRSRCPSGKSRWCKTLCDICWNKDE